MSRPLPPPLVRRLVTVPLALAVLPLLLVTLPFWILVGLVTSPFLPGSFRGLRLLWFGIVWFACEWCVLAALGWLWLRSGFGRRLADERWQQAHYDLLRWMLDQIYRTARWTFRLRVVGFGTGEPLRQDAPLLVLCRHAGPGDSVLLVRSLVALAQLRPRIVLKDALQLDPTVDILLNRLPTRFITPHPDVAADITAAIATLAAGAGPGTR